jgi:hypothetical protein
VAAPHRKTIAREASTPIDALLAGSFEMIRA